MLWEVEAFLSSSHSACIRILHCRLCRVTVLFFQQEVQYISLDVGLDHETHFGLLDTCGHKTSRGLEYFRGVWPASSNSTIAMKTYPQSFLVPE